MNPPRASLRSLLRFHQSRRPEAVYLYDADDERRRLSYAQLGAFSRRLAAQLRDLGYAPGDRIALLLPGGLESAAFTLGLMLAGYVAVPLNLLGAPETLGWVIEHSGARAVFCTADQEQRLDDALAFAAPQIPPARLTADGALFAAGQEEEGESPPAPEAPALLIYTSGTTGRPKGVLLTHANLVASAAAIAGWHRLTPQDRLLCALPLYHVNGLVIGLLAPFVSGGALVAPRRFSVSAWWGLVERFGCTWLNLVPTMIAFLLQNAPAQLVRFPAVRFARSASAPLPPAHHRQFEDRFGIPVIEGMGMTESASLAFCNPETGRVYGSVGLPCGVTAAVVDAQGRQVAEYLAGEIVLRGPSVMEGYYRDAAQTARAIDEQGWLHTGDLGYRDGSGYYFVTGRLKEIIIKGGENIAPREIDEALAAFPAVLEAAAFAVPDEHYGQNIAVALVLKPNCALDEAALREWCTHKLGAYRTPNRFYRVDQLPRGATGKIQRLALCRRFSVATAADGLASVIKK